MPIPPKAQKLILLLMDEAAAPNEREVAIAKLVKCLRTHYADGFELLADWGKTNNSPPPPPPPPRPSGPSPYGTFVMPFGMHKGKMLRYVPVAYLLYILDWPNLFPRTRTAIEKFLEQS